MSRRTLTYAFTISLITLMAVAAMFVGTGRSGEAGDVAAVEASLGHPVASTTPSTATSTTAGLPPPSDAVRPSSTVPIWPGRLSDTQVEEAILPVVLTVGSIDVEAPIIPTGVDARTGQMAVPRNVTEVAWYEFGPRPAESGSAVLAAHVDLANQGPGVFFRLRDVDPGDIVAVGFSDGSVRRFRVEARTIYQKDELPLDTIFAREGSPVLTLITCGGGFSESAGSYDSNVVVFAVPIPDREVGFVR
ncbi:MAG: class F sortase [Acidimicrobiia bacterium]|nr:class F sortase [Acidimicrobiia bacterium]